MRTPLSCLCLVALLGLGTGCSRNPDADWRVPREALLLEACPSAVALTNGVTRPFAELASNAVLVAVNGQVLTKGTFEVLMDLYLKGILQKKDMNSFVAEKMLEQHRSSYLGSFIRQRLLVDYAFQNGIVTTNEVLEAVSVQLHKIAKRRKQSVSKVLGVYGKEIHYFLYEQCISYIMDKVIHLKIPPLAVVDKNFVEAVKKQVQIENTASRVTNEVLRARLDVLRSQLVSGQKTLKEITDNLESSGIGEGGEWGVFAPDDFENATHAAKVFTLKEGEVSDILEDDDGFRVVKVEKILPEEKNPKGDLLNPEQRQLVHLHVNKQPLLIEDTDVVLTHDLKQQMQFQAITEFVSVLATNGLNKIVFPNGQISL